LMVLPMVAAGFLTAQTVATLPSDSVPAYLLPEPYGSDEFPLWTYSLRRFEIISLGAFPVLLFYSRIALDTGRYVGNGFDASYAPWPFRNEFSYSPDSNEQWLAVKVAVGLSLGVGLLDYFLLSRRKAGQQPPVDAFPLDPRRP
ncbi:MAG: hypothetical protein RBT68_14990, partial [Spirochaetia bacterium]|nr:hypothetical protein [Spirochaetia bacterium]